MKIRKLQVVTIALMASMMSSLATADVFAEAAKTGANAGAMKSVEITLSRKTMKKFDTLDGDDKAKALVYRKAAGDQESLCKTSDYDVAVGLS